MVSTWLTQLGDWNPQLLREVNGRLQRRNVLVTTAVSLVTQLFIAGQYWCVVGSGLEPNAVILDDGWFQIFDTVTWVAMLALLFFV